MPRDGRYPNIAGAFIRVCPGMGAILILQRLNLLRQPEMWVVQFEAAVNRPWALPQNIPVFKTSN